MTNCFFLSAVLTLSIVLSYQGINGLNSLLLFMPNALISGCEVAVKCDILISQQSHPSFPFKPPSHPHSFTTCLQRTDRHGTRRKHEKSKAARASTRCAIWLRTQSSNSGPILVLYPTTIFH